MLFFFPFFSLTQSELNLGPTLLIAFTCLFAAGVPVNHAEKLRLKTLFPNYFRRISNPLKLEQFFFRVYECINSREEKKQRIVEGFFTEHVH